MASKAREKMSATIIIGDMEVKATVRTRGPAQVIEHRPIVHKATKPPPPASIPWV